MSRVHRLVVVAAVVAVLCTPSARAVPSWRERVKAFEEMEAKDGPSHPPALEQQATARAPNATATGANNRTARSNRTEFAAYSSEKEQAVQEWLGKELERRYHTANEKVTVGTPHDGEVDGQARIEGELRRWRENTEQGQLKWDAMRSTRNEGLRQEASRLPLIPPQDMPMHIAQGEIPQGLHEAVRQWHRAQGTAQGREGGGPPLIPWGADDTAQRIDRVRKVTCAGQECVRGLQEDASAFLETSSHTQLAADSDDKYKAGCFCSGNPNLMCEQACTCTLSKVTSDNVLYGGTLLHDAHMLSLLQTETQYDPTSDDLQDTAYGGEPETCLGDGRWCKRSSECCDKCECTRDHVCVCEKEEVERNRPIKRRPSPATGRDEASNSVLRDEPEHERSSLRLGGGEPEPKTWDSALKLDCACTKHNCLFNASCDCRRPDEWETWRCALMGFRGRAIKLEGQKRQYLQFFYPPFTCAEFTLEFWVKPGPGVRTWSRFVDVGAGTHRWLMLSPRGGGWWGMCAIWRWWWWWGWVRTEQLPEGMWSHVALLFGYWHVCLLIDGQYRHCRWNHWYVRNAWRYWHRWRNWVGRSQYWWDPYLSAEIDEMRVWCGYRSGYWINKYMYRRLEHRPWHLIGLWRFNENSGRYAHDSARSNHLVLRRAGDWQVIHWGAKPAANEDARYPKFVVSDVPVFHRVHLCPKDLPRPQPRYGLRFGGAKFRQAWLFLPHALLRKLRNFTIEGWLRVPHWVRDHWMRFFDIGMGDWYPWRNILLHPGLPGVRPMFFGGRHPKHGLHYQAVVAPPMARNRWVHVAAVLNSGTASIVIDGRQVASGAMATHPLEICGHWNFIGRSAYWWDNYFYGEISDLRFWNYGRSVTEINMQRRVPLTGSEPGLVAYYSFGEAGGRRAMDQTANHFDAPIIGNVGYVRSKAPILPLF